jgi:hypothetical protein
MGSLLYGPNPGVNANRLTVSKALLLDRGDSQKALSTTLQPENGPLLFGVRGQSPLHMPVGASPQKNFLRGRRKFFGIMGMGDNMRWVWVLG